jgi:putative transcriptional regulator
MSKTSTFVRMQSDGTMVRLKPDGTEEKITVSPVTPRSDEAVTEAALRDPDAQPLTDADLARMKRVPRVKTLRRALGLTQEEFAARYHIPLGTLRDWEQGRCEPDQPARAYLTVIAHDPEGVKHALQAGPQPH